MLKKVHGENQYKEMQKTLKAQCEQCCGLCCTALYFVKSEGFPQDKEAGRPCMNLQPDFKCGIHSALQSHGMKGCLAYDCFGAGQIVTQGLYEGLDWRRLDLPEAEQMFRVFFKVYQLRQMLWYLIETASLSSAGRMNGSIRSLIAENRRMTEGTPQAIEDADIDEYKTRVNKVLRTSVDCVQKAIGQKEGEIISQKQTLDYIGRNFKRQDLTGRDFSMTLLIAADLRGCRLAGTNFLGADLRDARLDNVDLRDSLFLTQMQVNEAKGNRSTRLPDALEYPQSWL